jgi:LacI family transcriptional regulator
MANIRDVAKRAGVSVKTVSRIINNEPLVRDETRSKVLLAMQDLNYMPNISAQRMARGESRVIGLLQHRGNVSHYITEILRGMMEICTAEGYGVTIYAYNTDKPNSRMLVRQEILQLVGQQFVDGLLFTPPCDSSDELLAELQAMSAPFVRISPSNPRLPYPYVNTQDRQGAYEMTAHLISLGHTRIGFITGALDHAESHDRLAGFKAALADNRIAFDPDLLQNGDYSYEAGLICGRTLLRRADPPSAIFASNDDMAAGVMYTAAQLGIAVPDQLSVAGFDDDRISSRIWPGLTTVRQPTYEMARLATQMLIRRLHGQPLETLGFQLSTSLVIRGSTRTVIAL